MAMQDLYFKLPTLAQNLACSFFGYRLISRRYSKAYLNLEKDCIGRDYLNEPDLRSFCAQRFCWLVRHAVENVPYYNTLFNKLGLTIGDMKKTEDLIKLPILSKEEVRKDPSRFIPNNISSYKTSIVKTSGTTGAGLVFPMTLEAEQEQWAVWWRYRRRFGLDRSTWYAHFYGKSIVPFEQLKPPFWRINYPGKQIFFSAYHMATENLASYVVALNRYQPPWIQGYPSLLAILADYILSSGNFLNYTPKAVTLGSESLMPHQKHKIEIAFKIKCHQHYGMAEASANISECAFGKLHVDEDFGHIEFIPNEYGTYDIVSTGYSNKAFVLLRYKVGDTATLDDHRCPCGRLGRIVGSIDGRIEDYIVTTDGRKIGRLDHIVKDMVNIKECQIIQESLERIVIKVVKGLTYNNVDENKLMREARKRIGKKINIDIEYVREIERTTTGKLRFVVSRL
ncbi:MAG: hypothetical protein R3B95_17600 [Nitrospirales bacterium]|nr:hypothetical protein [Nitrospirales bacterium]